MQHHGFYTSCLVLELSAPAPTDWCPRAGLGLVHLPVFGTQEPHREERIPL